VDVTPLVPGDRQLIESYGEGKFRISGQVHQGSVLVFPRECVAWPVATMAEVTANTLAPVVARRGDVAILLLGCGRRMAPVPGALRAALREAGIVVDTMDTGAACRTYNILMSEDRRVAAALLAVE